MKQIYCELNQVGSSGPGKKKDGGYNIERFSSNSYEEVLEKLKDKFGIVPPKRKNPIYADVSGFVQIGFVTSRWNRDCSHLGKSWWEENWVSF